MADEGLIKLGLVSTIVDETTKPAKDIANSLLGMLEVSKKVETELPSSEDSKGGWGLISSFGKSAMHKGIEKSKAIMGAFIGRGKKSLSGRMKSMFEGFTNMIKPSKLMRGARKIGTSMKGIAEKSSAIAKDFFTLNEQSSKFDKILIGVGATIAGYIGFRALKAQMTDLVTLGAEYEAQWMRLANTTGDPEFAAGTREFINKATLQFPGIEETLYGISDSLAKMGVDFREIGKEGVAGIASAAAYLGDYKGDFQSAYDSIQNLAKSPGEMTAFMEQFTSVSSGMLQGLQLDTAGTTQAIANNMKSITGMMTTVYGDNLARIADTTTVMTGKIRTRFEQFRETIVGVGTESGTLYSAYKKTLRRITDLVDNYGPQLTAFAKSIGKVFAMIWGGIDKMIGGIINKFKVFLDKTGDTYDDFSKNRMMPIITYLAIIGSRMKSLVSGMWKGFSETLGFIYEFVKPAIKWIGELSEKVFGFTDKLSKDKDSMKSAGVIIGGIAGAFLAFKGLTAILTPIVIIAGKLFAMLGLGPLGIVVAAVAGIAFFYKAWTEDWGGIQEKFANAWGWIQDKLSNIGASIKEWFSGIDWMQVGETLVEGLITAFSYAIGFYTKAYNFAGELMDTISGWISGIDWFSIGGTISDFLVGSFKTAISNVISFFKGDGGAGGASYMDLGGAFFGYLKSALSLSGNIAIGIYKLGAGIVDGIISAIAEAFGLGEAWDKVKSAVSGMIRKIMPDWIAKKLGFDDAPVITTIPGEGQLPAAEVTDLNKQYQASEQNIISTRESQGRSTISSIASTKVGGDQNFAPGSIVFNVNADKTDPKQFARDTFDELETIKQEKRSQMGVVN